MRFRQKLVSLFDGFADQQVDAFFKQAGNWFC